MLNYSLSSNYLCDYLNGIVSLPSGSLSYSLSLLNNKVNFYTQKTMILGEYVYHYEYSPLYLVSNNLKILSSYHERTPEELQDLQKIYIKKSKKTLKELILCNLPNGQAKFLTLTYASPEFNKKKANNDFKNFIKRLKYSTKINLRYIAVSEEHDSQATKSDRVHSYHFHVLIFDLPFLSAKVYSEVWTHGFIKINRVFGDNIRMANYVAKYLSKCPSEKYHKRYLSSRNLVKPSTVSLNSLPLLEFVSACRYNRFAGGVVHREVYKIYNYAK